MKTTNRPWKREDGKEEVTPAVLILAAGLGSRLDKNTADKNKALLPINNKAVISYIIEKFPKEYDVVIAVGYKKESLKEYCSIVHADRKLIFVDVEGWEDPKVKPGSSAFQCKHHLMRPFYLVTADCIIDSDLPILHENWLGISPTSRPEVYSTIKVDSNDNVIEFIEKSKTGHDNAWIGLAGIWDYEVFWRELERDNPSWEIVLGWRDAKAYPTLKAKRLVWLDTGNIVDFQKTKLYFKDDPVSMYKTTGEIAYKVGHRFLKYNPDTNVTQNRHIRGLKLNGSIPRNFSGTTHFISYDWDDGSTLFRCDSLSIYLKFLEWYENVLKNVEFYFAPELINPFYIDKTNARKRQFLAEYGESYATTAFTINGKRCPSFETLFTQLDFSSLKNDPFYAEWHGDMHFENIVYNQPNDSFVYIDWRESFANSTQGGDVYYDLSKLYLGCGLPLNLLKNDDTIEIVERGPMVDYKHAVMNSAMEFKPIYEAWIAKNGFDLKKVKFITNLLYLNMSPLHTDKFNKVLWFKSIEGMCEFANL